MYDAHEDKNRSKLLRGWETRRDDPFTLGELLSLTAPESPLTRAVRARQTIRFVTIVPSFIVANFIIATVMAVILAPSVPLWQLCLWLGIDALVAFHFVRRHRRIRTDDGYRARHPVTFATATRGTAIFSAFWLIVPLFWFDLVPPFEQAVLLCFGALLLVAGAFMLVFIPPASLAYIIVMSGCGLLLATQVDSTIVALATVMIAIALLLTSHLIARELFRQTSAQLQLQEMAELVELLRDLGAPGSGGLWELGPDLKFTKLSSSLADAMGRSIDRVVGLSVFRMVDPDGNYRNLSTGMRQLFAHFQGTEAFRDVVVPQIYSDRWWSVSGQPLFDEDGELIGWRGVASDVTELRTANADALGAARTDPLTGIANRVLLREMLEEALLPTGAEERQCALLLVDLDRFKFVNDTLGHTIGDELLVMVAQRLIDTVSEHGSVGRLGGDEFAVIFEGPTDRYSLSGLAERIIGDISRSFAIERSDVHVGATVGIAVAPIHGRAQDKLIRAADLALYSAKRSGRGGYAFFDPSMLSAAEDHRLLENDIRQALAADQLELAFQPIVDARTDRRVGYEALLRWTHPTRGVVSPERFIPIIEDAGLIHQIGNWVLRRACEQAARWPDNIRVAVNVSAAQLTGSGLARTVVDVLSSTGVAPNRLELEVTENIFIGDNADMLGSIERLRGLGVRMVLDDFGKGYSSFGYLSRAHFSKIKIDRIFVRQAAAGDPRGIAIVDAIVALAKGLGIDTTAEGVESEAEADAMRLRDIGSLQGYLFGRPVVVATGDENVIDLDAHRSGNAA